jgi:hypothetical protein
LKAALTLQSLVALVALLALGPHGSLVAFLALLVPADRRLVLRARLAGLGVDHAQDAEALFVASVDHAGRARDRREGDPGGGHECGTGEKQQAQTPAA